jgi:uncharacterized protein YchJ
MAAENAEKSHVINLRCGPCPRCGGDGHVPSGTYTIARGIIHALLSSASSQQELQRLAEILQRAKDANQSAGQAAETIERELPQFSAVSRELKVARFALAVAIIDMALNAVQVMIALHASGAPAPVNQSVVVNQTVNNYYLQPEANQQRPTAIECVDGKPPPGRNEPCTCGSGKKYKHCHGAIAK